MNNKQRRVILCGFIVILLMGIFPPWTKAQLAVVLPWHPLDSTSTYGYDVHDGYKWLGTSRTKTLPSFVDRKIYRRVDCSLLLVQWFLVSAVTGIFVMFLGDRPQSPVDKPEE